MKFMKTLKLFEEFSNTVWFIDLEVGGHEGFTTESIFYLSSKLIGIFETNDIKYEVYYYTDKGVHDDINGILFLFNEKVLNAEQLDLSFEEIDREELPEDMEDYKVDKDFIFANVEANKYNL